jgi:hypothetical protein
MARPAVLIQGSGNPADATPSPPDIPLTLYELLHDNVCVSRHPVVHESPVGGKVVSSRWPLQVPKMLGLLRGCWAPASFVVSFKLETDPTLLLLKV